MLKPSDAGLKFLIISSKFWGKGDNIKLLKRKASRDSKWPKGAKRVYRCYLVHEDTVINDKHEFVFPSEKARETALYLGTV